MAEPQVKVEEIRLFKTQNCYAKLVMCIDKIVNEKSRSNMANAEKLDLIGLLIHDADVLDEYWDEHFVTKYY